jgi:hypothetical protein
MEYVKLLWSEGTLGLTMELHPIPNVGIRAGRPVLFLFYGYYQLFLDSKYVTARCIAWHGVAWHDRALHCAVYGVFVLVLRGADVVPE